MNAVVYRGPRQVAVQSVPDPVSQAPTDAIVRLTTTALCGSDLHAYDGRTSATAGDVIGHEPLGIVEWVGSAVVSVKRGDRVVIPTHANCAFCDNCERGYSGACLTVNPPNYGAAYGYPGMGTLVGAQAQLLRVPFADANCLIVPGEEGDDLEDDFVLLADAFVTGYHAATLAHVAPGSTVAVFGAGAVGLLSAYSALLRGAAEVYVVDGVDARLRIAESLGAVPVDLRRGDPVEQIFALRRGERRAGPRGPRAEQMAGVMCAIDAVGFQARDRSDMRDENPTQLIDDLARVVNPTGSIAMIGVWAPHDPHPIDTDAGSGRFTVPWGTFFQKGISVRFGRTHDEKYNRTLRDLIVSGRAKPSRIVTQRLPLGEAPAAYDAFDRRAEGYVKVLFTPN
jgi:glutathione-independent formaldehyde dehydrogenase